MLSTESCARVGFGGDLHLIVDPLFSPRALTRPRPGRSPGGTTQDLSTLALLSGPAQLIVDADREPRLAPVTTPSSELLLEPLADATQPRILLLCGAGAPPLLVNGRPVPPVAVLHVGDQLLVGADCLLHVSLYRQPAVGPATDAQIGAECPLCRLTVERDDEVFTCPRGCVLHHRSAPRGDDATVVECARLASTCPGCGQPVSLEEGFTHVPDLR